MSNGHYITSDDLSMYAQENSEYVPTYVLVTVPGMWGSAMFGSPLLLGSGELRNVLSGYAKYVLSDDGSLYVARRPVLIFISEMITPPGMWGSAMFGSSALLGTGSLNSVEA